MEWYKRILIPTDGSNNSRRAIEHGLELAKLLNSDVTAVSVIDVSDLASRTQVFTPTPLASTQADVTDAAVAEVAMLAKGMGVRATTQVRMGSPALDIIEMSQKYDLIVMGTKGRTGLPHLLMGSVAEKVVREAKCPVLVVKATD
jgi:nucleotide-binding universal stress UspA family protein